MDKETHSGVSQTTLVHMCEKIMVLFLLVHIFDIHILSLLAFRNETDVCKRILHKHKIDQFGIYHISQYCYV